MVFAPPRVHDNEDCFIYDVLTLIIIVRIPLQELTFVVLLTASLSIEHKQALVQAMSPRPSVALCSVRCTVAKRLIGSGCRLGGRSTGSKDNASRWGGDCPMGRGNSEGECGAYNCNQWAE